MSRPVQTKTPRIWNRPNGQQDTQTFVVTQAKVYHPRYGWWEVKTRTFKELPETTTHTDRGHKEPKTHTPTKGWVNSRRTLDARPITTRELDQSRGMFYTLDDEQREHPAQDVVEWGLWFNESEDERRIGFYENDRVEVSTVFIGINLNYRQGQPLLYETLVRWDNGQEETYRYSTRREAEVGHQAIVELVSEQH